MLQSGSMYHQGSNAVSTAEPALVANTPPRFSAFTAWDEGSRALSVAGQAGASTVARKPNIVFIHADDIGYGDLNCYGATPITAGRDSAPSPARSSSADHAPQSPPRPRAASAASYESTTRSLLLTVTSEPESRRQRRS